MPEVRAQLNTELHRKLKAKAAHLGIPLKELIVQVLTEYMAKQESGGGTKSPGRQRR